MTKILKDKSILVTGGTGSFGRNFIKYLLDNSEAKRIIIFSRDELKQSQMEREFNSGRLRFFIGDVRDEKRLQRAFHGVDIVVHAAALKQVPTLEYNPFEAIKTNIMGSQNVIDAAIDQGVKTVLLVSTDKAAQPVNLYGSTKLCAEKLFVNANLYAANKTKFSCVRYGNVIASRGSIIETLLDAKNEAKVQITDERMTRFWISLKQSFDLVFYALNNMEGGEIFIPKIPSMKLGDLFDCLAPGMEREIIGIRPGEKMHEILLTDDEAGHSYEFDNYYVILPDNRKVFPGKDRFSNILSKGKSLPENFIYKSDQNGDWLTKESFNEIIKKQII